LPIGDCRLGIAMVDWRMTIALRIGECRLLTVDWPLRMSIADCRLPIGDCRLPIEGVEKAIGNQKSAIANTSSA